MTERQRMQLQFGALVGGLLLLGASGGALGAFVRPSAPGDEALNGAGWEGRRLIAQMLWVKTHAVLHAGAEERAARPGEETTRKNEFHTHGGAKPAAGGHEEPGHEEPGHEKPGHEEHGDEPGHADPGHEEPGHDGHGHDEHGDEDGHVLVIPPASEDFRGVLGDLERAVKPYSGANGKMYSKDSSQTLPFYRLMTWADPHYIQGYTVGSTFINKVGKDPDSALEFLREGERYNPRSFEIQTELGHIYLVYKKDYASAEKHLKYALELLPDRKLTELEEDARTDAIRWLAINYVQWEKPAEAVRMARYGRGLIGQDPSLDHILAHQGRK